MISRHHLVVFGGNGYIGQHICKAALSHGFKVTSISRNGQPRKQYVTAGEMNWAVGDALEPETYKSHLKSATAIIHSIGILFEDPAKGITYERVHFTTAEKIAKTISDFPNIKSFVYISAETSPPIPFLSPRFLSMKRHAEEMLQHQQHFKTLILRPGFVYRPASWWMKSAAAGNKIGLKIMNPITKSLFGWKWLCEPTNVEILSEAAILGIEDEKTGILNSTDIQQYVEFK